MTTSKVSVVVPTFNRAHNLQHFVEKLIDLGKASHFVFEIILVDDCSYDQTWKVLEDLYSSFDNLTVVRLRRNLGQHASTIVGISLASGEIVVTMDDDEEFQLEDLQNLVVAVENGADLAIAVSQNELASNGLRGIVGRGFNALLNRLLRIPPQVQLTTFRAFNRRLTSDLAGTNLSYPYLTALLLMSAENHTLVPVHFSAKRLQKSTYTFPRRASLALDLILGYTNYVSRLVATVGSCALFVALASAIYVVGLTITKRESVDGWPSIVLAISLSTSVLLLILLLQTVLMERIYKLHTDRTGQLPIHEILR
jgi:glycosyltransferase involved in cell wall biosynthesis